MRSSSLKPHYYMSGLPRQFPKRSISSSPSTSSTPFSNMTAVGIAPQILARSYTTIQPRSGSPCPSFVPRHRSASLTTKRPTSRPYPRGLSPEFPNLGSRSLQTMVNTSSPVDTAAGNGRFVKIVEVGPRDGLQNISGPPVPTLTKLELVNRLLDSGMKVVEAGSFVRPDRVPQMADTPTLLPRLRPVSIDEVDVHYPVLVPNMRGLDNLFKLEDENQKAGKGRLTDEIAIFVAASDGFSEANNGAPVAKVLASLPPVVSKATQRGYRVRGYVSVVMTDPYTGPVEPEEVVRVVKALDHMGCYEISLGDTTGEGDPERWQTLWKALQREGLDMNKFAAHCHDTFATALPSLLSLLPLGLRTIDASVSGLGGCPYSPGATGNVATEDVVYMLHKLGYQTGIDLDKLVETGEWISGALGRRNESRVGRALAARKNQGKVKKAKTSGSDTEDGA